MNPAMDTANHIASIDTRRVDAQCGILLGVVYGDVLGAPFEFGNRGRMATFDGNIDDPDLVARRTNEWGFTVQHAHAQATDDSEMTIACLGVVLSGYSLDKAVDAYHAYCNSHSYTLGSNTRALFHGYKRARSGYQKRYTDRFATAAAVESSQSNGHLMRCAPISFIDDEQVRNVIAELDCRLTNPSSIAIRASLCFVDLLAKAQRSPSTEDAIRMVRMRVQSEAEHDVEGCFADALSDTFARNMEQNRGWTLHSLSLALWLSLHDYDLHSGVVFAVKCGGDTDTNASISGALLGAIHGNARSRMNPRLVANVALMEACVPKVQTSNARDDSVKVYNRPESLHPSNILHFDGTAPRIPTLANAVVDLEKIKVMACMRMPIGKRIAIMGASSAGKSTLARRLVTWLKRETGLSATIVSQDSFRRKGVVNVREEDGKRSWEASYITDWMQMTATIESKSQTHDVTIVEGYTLGFAPTAILTTMDVIFYIESSIETCISRRKSFPTSDKYGSEGWPTVEAYIRACVWPHHMSHESTLPRSIIRLKEDATSEERAATAFKHLPKWSFNLPPADLIKTSS